MKVCEQHGQTNCACIPVQNKTTGNKSALSEGLDRLLTYLQEQQKQIDEMEKNGLNDRILTGHWNGLEDAKGEIKRIKLHYGLPV